MSNVRSVGPFVGLAVLCRNVERQPDGSTHVLSIVDGFELDSPYLDRADPAEQRLLAVLRLEAGDLRGNFTVAVRGRYPEGVEGPMCARLVEFTDDKPRALLIIQITIEMSHVGTYWFDVTVDQRMLTRIPLVARRRDLARSSV
jgi:hypothetical protein